MSARHLLPLVSVFLWFGFTGPALAEEDIVPMEPASVARRLAKDGAISSTLQRAAEGGRGFAVATTSYNSVTDKAAVDVAGQVHLTGRFSLVLRVDNAISDAARPGIGAAVQLLDEARHGVASTGYLLYKAEGFAEPEGELEALASFGRSFGALRGVANVAYGQDPEGNERDGEVALGVSVEPIERLSTGLIARYRDALGSRGDGGVIRDVFGGASTSFAFGRFGITGLAGVSGIETKTAGSMKGGVSAAVSVGAAF
jgi:hypothetical protein